jgi:hypothetical protein
MQLTVVVATLLASVASARTFTLYNDRNFGGTAHTENRNDDAACCMYLLCSQTENLPLTGPREPQRQGRPSQLCTRRCWMHHILSVSPQTSLSMNLVVGGHDCLHCYQGAKLPGKQLAAAWRRIRGSQPHERPHLVVPQSVLGGHKDWTAIMLCSEPVESFFANTLLLFRSYLSTRWLLILISLMYGNADHNKLLLQFLGS